MRTALTGRDNQSCDERNWWDRPLPSLPRARNAEIDVRTLAPWIGKYAQNYGVNPQIVAAVVAQESSFINHGVHDDGTGHGLIGLDDNGLLPEFEKWSGTRVGRGHRANTIAPEKQIEFLAMKLDKLTEKFGNREWEAVRAWHGGSGGRNRPHAKHYEQLIRARIPQIAHAVPRVVSGAAAPEEMLASSYQLNAPKPVALQSEEGTPIRGVGIDYETA